MFAVHLKDRPGADHRDRLVDAEPIDRRAVTPNTGHHRTAPIAILHGWGIVIVGLGTVVVALALVTFVWTPVASAVTPVGLGTAAPFAVSAGQEVTDVPTSSITGNSGLITVGLVGLAAVVGVSAVAVRRRRYQAVSDGADPDE